jgi:hypothetical protein
MNGRAYDYQLGRFLSVDPFIQGTSSDAINPYSYIGNNPLSGTDPSGYASCDINEKAKDCLGDGVNDITKDGEVIGHVVVGQKGDTVSVSNGSETATTNIQKGNKWTISGIGQINGEDIQKKNRSSSNAGANDGSQGGPTNSSPAKISKGLTDDEVESEIKKRFELLDGKAGTVDQIAEDIHDAFIDISMTYDYEINVAMFQSQMDDKKVFAKNLDYTKCKSNLSCESTLNTQFSTFRLASSYHSHGKGSLFSSFSDIDIWGDIVTYNSGKYPSFKGSYLGSSWGALLYFNTHKLFQEKSKYQHLNTKDMLIEHALKNYIETKRLN